MAAANKAPDEMRTTTTTTLVKRECETGNLSIG